MATMASVPVPEYLNDHNDPAALFSRLQRVVIHMELLQSEAVREFDISFRDFVILATLYKEPAPHQLLVTQIAAYVLRPLGSISQTLDRIERAGYISRASSTDDRRKVAVALTPTGIEFIERAKGSYDDTRQRVLKTLTHSQLEQIDSAVTTLLDALDQDYRDHGR